MLLLLLLLVVVVVLLVVVVVLLLLLLPAILRPLFFCSRLGAPCRRYSFATQRAGFDKMPAHGPNPCELLLLLLKGKPASTADAFTEPPVESEPTAMDGGAVAEVRAARLWPGLRGRRDVHGGGEDNLRVGQGRLTTLTSVLCS